MSTARPFHFRRVHIPTGRVWAADFNGTHSPCWGEDWAFYPLRRLQEEAARCIADWNRSQPSTWIYALADGPAQKNTV